MNLKRGIESMTHADSNSTKASAAPPLHMIDIIRRKRDGGELDVREIAFVAAGAANGSIPEAELAAWLMASWLKGLSLSETRALTLAMRDSGEKFSPVGLGRRTVDKHSSGGVGDKTSFLVALLAAGCPGASCAYDQRSRALGPHWCRNAG